MLWLSTQDGGMGASLAPTQGKAAAGWPWGGWATHVPAPTPALACYGCLPSSCLPSFSPSLFLHHSLPLGAASLFYLLPCLCTPLSFHQDTLPLSFPCLCVSFPVSRMFLCLFQMSLPQLSLFHDHPPHFPSYFFVCLSVSLHPLHSVQPPKESWRWAP